MAEGTYEYECMRAELLGIEKPDFDEFQKRQQLAKEVEEEQIETECITNSENSNTSMNTISNRLDELNTILASTQKRISRFKTSCGSFTNMIKAKIGRNDSSNSLNTEQNTTEIVNPSSEQQNLTELSERQKDLCRGVDGNLEKLDSLIDKAEMAHNSMLEQRKQMNKFLK